MTVIHHPEFAQDIRKFEAEYQEISAGLATRFRSEVADAFQPGAAYKPDGPLGSTSEPTDADGLGLRTAA